MNKFFKWSGIIAGILLAIGLVLIFASTVMGGRRALITLGEGIREVDWDELDEVLETAEGLEFNIGENGLKISLSGEGGAKLSVNGVTITAGEQRESFSAADVQSMKLSLGAGEFIIRTKDTDDGKIDIFVTGVGDCNYYIEEGNLVVDGFQKAFGISTGSISEVILEIPSGMFFEEVEAEVGAGTMQMEDITAGEVEASIGAGELTLKRIKANEFSAKIGAGQVIAKEMDVQNAEIDVSMGECIFNGSIRGNLDAECDMGNLELKLKGKQSEHNYQIECAAGNIDMDGYHMAALAGEKKIDNGADSEYDISCNMGNITVEFE